MSEENTAPSRPNPKLIGQSIGLVIIIAFVAVAAVAIWSHDNRPQTDDATLRANFIGVAPQASGHIVELACKRQSICEGRGSLICD